MATTLDILKRAKEASSEIALLSTEAKNLALSAMADAL
jgi:gamma-glutamyl phosphate reductase